MSRLILVTGSGRGIGAATAIRLAAEGYSICVNYASNHDAAEGVVKQIRAQGGRAFAVQADVSKEQQVQSLFARIDEQPHRLYGLVNNAGILMQQMRVEEMTEARINRMLTANVTGYFLCAREAIGRMSTRYGGHGGVIINVSSAAARIGSAGEYVDYAASKGAIDSFTVGLANEVIDEGIRVNAVRPGFIDTEMHADGGEPDRLERIKVSIPMQRGGSVDEVAAAIAWLVSDQSSYTMGSFIEVAGGR